jgi:hypothetical protein
MRLGSIDRRRFAKGGVALGALSLGGRRDASERR